MPCGNAHVELKFLSTSCKSCSSLRIFMNFMVKIIMLQFFFAIKIIMIHKQIVQIIVH